MRKQRIAIGRIFGKDRNAYARCNAAAITRTFSAGLHDFENGLGETASHGGVGESRNDNGELIATEPGHHLAFIETGGDALCNTLKHSIACRMPEQVIHFLEPVEIDAQDRQALPAVSGKLDLTVELGVESYTVGQTGKHVMVRKKINVIFCLFSCREIADRNGTMRLAGKIDGSLNELNGCPHAIKA